MLNIKTVRDTLRALVTNRMAIDVWDVDVPPAGEKLVNMRYFPRTAAVAHPVMNLQYEGGKSTRAHDVVMADFPFVVRFRFMKERYPTVHDLPISQIESLYLAMCQVAYKGADQCADVIKQIGLSPLEYNIVNGETQDQPFSWLVTFQFNFNVEFYAGEADGTEFPDIIPGGPGWGTPDFEIKGIDLEVDRGFIDNIKPSITVYERRILG